MLSYRQKIQVDPPRGKVKMDRFDLYADLPPLLPVEDQTKPPVMTSRVISTLQKYPYMAGRRASSAGTGKSSSNDTWLLNRSKSLAETRQSRHMLESTPPSLEGQMPKRKANDCLEVIPQNTVPMAKYRKNFVRKKLLKHTAEMEGTITDEDLWKRRKTQEEQARIASFKRRQAGDEGGKLEWATQAEGFGQIETKKTLEEEIYKPTYVADADLDEETFFRALGKSIPRKKIAVVSAVMQKIEKRKQEKEERKVNERMMMEIHEERQRGETEREVGAMGAESVERKDDKEKLPENSDDKNNKSQVANEETKATEIVAKAEPITSTTSVASSAADRDDAPRRHDDVTVTSRDDERPEPTTQPAQSQNRRPVDRNASLLRRTGIAKSEGDLQAALGGGMRTPAFPPPPDTFCDTRTMISYSEILMASARNLTRTVSMIDVEPPGARDFYPLTYIPQLSHVATSTSAADDEVFILPPEILPSTGSEASLSRAKSLGQLSNRLTGSREPLYAKSLAKSRSALHVRNPSSSARSRTRRSLEPLESRRSRRHQDAQFLHRIASIVEKQNELLDRWQATDKTPKKAKSSILRRRSKSLYDIREKYRRPPEQQTVPLGDRPVTSHGVYRDDVTARSSADPYSSSSESDEVYGGLETKFDDITAGALAKASQSSIGNVSSQVLAGENALSKGYATEDSNPVYATKNPSNALENEPNQVNVDENDPDDQQPDTGANSKSIKPIKPPRHSIELARSRSKTPNAKIVSAAAEIQKRNLNLDHTNKGTSRPIPTSRTPRPPSSAAMRPLSRSETMGKELAKDASQVIKIDIIESRDERVDSRAESRMSRAESRTSRAAGSRMSTRTPEDALKRRRSLIRVKGISTRRGETPEALKSKIQSVVDAGTGMGGDEDGWWVLWSRQEGAGAKKNGLLSRFSKLGKGGLGKPKDLSIVAEVVQKLPGETVYDDIVAANVGDSTVAGHQEDVYAVAIKQKHRVRTSLTGDSQKKKNKKRRKSDAPSHESYRSLLDAPEYSCDDEVSDVPPLPSEEWKSVYASVSTSDNATSAPVTVSRSKPDSASVTPVSASVSRSKPAYASVTSVSGSVSRPKPTYESVNASVRPSIPASAVREPSFDSGISTQPTDDEQRDVSPKPRDRQSLGRDEASTSAASGVSREEKSLLLQDENDKDGVDSGADEPSVNREEGFMKKVANFFGVSYEEDPEEFPLNNIFQKRGILTSG